MRAALLHWTSIGLFVMFICGQLLSTLAKAGFAVRATTNPLGSRRQYIWLFWDVLLYRGVIVLMLFWSLACYPAAFTKAAQAVGLTWNLNFPIVPPAAFFAGLLGDMVLEFLFNKVPQLRIDLPPLPEHQAHSNPAPLAGAAAGGA